MQGEMPARLQFFKQSFELKIKGDLIPEAAAEGIIGELQALFARHNAGGRAHRRAVNWTVRDSNARERL